MKNISEKLVKIGAIVSGAALGVIASMFVTTKEDPVEETAVDVPYEEAPTEETCDEEAKEA